MYKYTSVHSGKIVNLVNFVAYYYRLWCFEKTSIERCVPYTLVQRIFSARHNYRPWNRVKLQFLHRHHTALRRTYLVLGLIKRPWATLKRINAQILRMKALLFIRKKKNCPLQHARTRIIIITIIVIIMSNEASQDISIMFGFLICIQVNERVTAHLMLTLKKPSARRVFFPYTATHKRTVADEKKISRAVRGVPPSRFIYFYQ